MQRDVDVEVNGKRFAVTVWVPESAAAPPVAGGGGGRPQPARSAAGGAGGGAAGVRHGHRADAGHDRQGARRGRRRRRGRSGRLRARGHEDGEQHHRRRRPAPSPRSRSPPATPSAPATSSSSSTEAVQASRRSSTPRSTCAIGSAGAEDDGPRHGRADCARTRRERALGRRCRRHVAQPDRPSTPPRRWRADADAHAGLRQAGRSPASTQRPNSASRGVTLPTVTRRALVEQAQRTGPRTRPRAEEADRRDDRRCSGREDTGSSRQERRRARPWPGTRRRTAWPRAAAGTVGDRSGAGLGGSPSTRWVPYGTDRSQSSVTGSVGGVGERLGQRRVHEQALDDVGDPQAGGDGQTRSPR